MYVDPFASRVSWQPSPSRAGLYQLPESGALGVTPPQPSTRTSSTSQPSRPPTELSEANRLTREVGQVDRVVLPAARIAAPGGRASQWIAEPGVDRTVLWTEPDPRTGEFGPRRTVVGRDFEDRAIETTGGCILHLLTILEPQGQRIARGQLDRRRDQPLVADRCDVDRIPRSGAADRVAGDLCPGVLDAAGAERPAVRAGLHVIGPELGRLLPDRHSPACGA